MPPAKPTAKKPAQTAPAVSDLEKREAALKTQEADLRKREGEVAKVVNINTRTADDLENISKGNQTRANKLNEWESDLAKREDAVKALVQKVETEAGQTTPSGQLEAGEVRIVAKRDGFRRAGMAHPAKSIVHPVGTFDDAQLEQLRQENARPNSKLVVEFG